MANIRIDDLSNEISKALNTYTTEVTEGLEEVKKKVTREGVRTLREKSPVDTGRYAKGWAATEQDGAVIVHNRYKPQLTHLLEFGHAKRGGGRQKGEPHIEPVETQMINALEKGVEKVIRG